MAVTEVASAAALRIMVERIVVDAGPIMVQ